MQSCVKEFNAYWSTLIQNICNDSNYKDIFQSINWLERLMKDNVPHGKQVRGLTFLQLYRDLVSVRTSKQDELSYIVAWCIEIMQTSYLIADDIMDSSETRRGSPCWYRLPEVGQSAVNDSLLLENLVYQLLTNSVEDKALLMELTQMFLVTSYKTILGQSLDTRISIDKIYDKYTIGAYSAIVKYKTSFYTFYQPTALALILAGLTKPEHLRPVEEVSLQLGHLFQVQDDYIDCFSDPKLSGKIGTDIIDAKCSWLAVTALSLMTKEQRTVFEEVYGVNDEKAEIIIKGLYKELNITAAYLEFQKVTYDQILKTIETLAPEIPKPSFVNILNTIYKREK